MDNENIQTLFEMIRQLSSNMDSRFNNMDSKFNNLESKFSEMREELSFVKKNAELYEANSEEKNQITQAEITVLKSEISNINEGLSEIRNFIFSDKAESKNISFIDRKEAKDQKDEITLDEDLLIGNVKTRSSKNNKSDSDKNTLPKFVRDKSRDSMYEKAHLDFINNYKDKTNHITQIKPFDGQYLKQRKGMVQISVKDATAFFEAINQYQQQTGTAVRCGYYIEENIVMRLSVRYGMKVEEFKALSNDDIFYLIRKSLAPNSASDFTVLLTVLVDLYLGSNPRFDKEDAMGNLYMQLLVFSKKFLSVVEFLVTDQDKRLIPSAGTEKGGLVHTFMNLLPKNLGNQIMQAMKLDTKLEKKTYSIEKFGDFIDDFNKKIEEMIWLPFQAYQPVLRLRVNLLEDYNILRTKTIENRNALNNVEVFEKEELRRDDEEILDIAGQSLSLLDLKGSSENSTPKKGPCYRQILNECEDHKSCKFDHDYKFLRAEAEKICRRIIKKYNLGSLNLILEATSSAASLNNQDQSQM